MQNPYEDLLALVLAAPDRKLTLEVNVSTSALRKGVTKALAKHNQAHEVMDDIMSGTPDYVSKVVEGTVLVTEGDKAGIVTVAIGTKNNTTKFQSKLTFAVVPSTSSLDADDFDGGSDDSA